jgi:TRAP-type C4-dicarboxylate transport system permease small subunit
MLLEKQISQKHQERVDSSDARNTSEPTPFSQNSMQEHSHASWTRRSKRSRIFADNCEELIALALLSIIGLVMVLQVILRTVFSTPLSWPEEFSQFLFVWTSLLGAVGACKRLALVRLEVVADNLPAVARTILDYVVLVLIAVFLGILCWKGWQLATRTSFSAATLPITWAWAYAAVPVVSVLMVARLIQMQIFKYRFAFVEALFMHPHDAAGQEGAAK